MNTVTLTPLQDRILRDKQRHEFNSKEYKLRYDWSSGKSNWYPTYSEAEINSELSGLAEKGLANIATCMGITTLDLTEKGKSLACSLLS